MSEYDRATAVMRRNLIAKTEDEHQARLNRQNDMAQTCAEELAEILIRADLDDEEAIKQSIEQINAINMNARIFLLEGIQNLRQRRALRG